MELTPEERAMLKGKKGPRHAELMKLLATLGELNGAERLIPIWSAHLSGVSFKTMGLPGTEFLEDAAKEVRFSVPTTINPAGYDVAGPGLVKTNEDFKEKQDRIVRSLLTMGAIPTFTCTPYTTNYCPPRGAHLSWAESSAVIYTNSLLGAYSNREGAPTALASAVIGKTPDYGMHRPEGRKAQVVVDVDPKLESISYTLLGAHLGKLLGSKIPYIRGINPEVDSAKELGAAMSAWGSVPIFHIEGVTPEAGSQELRGLDMISVGAKEMAELGSALSSGSDPQLVALGCPHCTEKELTLLAEGIRKRGGRIKSGRAWWAFTNQSVISTHPELVEYLKKAGVKVIQDTCMVVAPLGKEFPVIAVNSAKAAFYASKRAFSGQRVVFGTTEELVARFL